MTDANVAHLFRPNADLMLQHLEHLFGGFLDGKHNGLIEIAWTDPVRDAKGRFPLRHARLFGTDQFEEAAEHAAQVNAIENQDVYVGAALRAPGTAPFGRCFKGDFYAAPCVFVDLDESDAAALAKTRYRGCPPTAVVVTGRTPNTRAQLWWRLEEPLTDPVALEAQNKGLIANFDGDQAVFNCDRVMRLAGSIAWPKKAGRQVERTELNLFPDRPPVALARLAKAFPPVAVAPLLDAPVQPAAPIGHGLAADFTVPPPVTPAQHAQRVTAYDQARGAISGQLSSAVLIAQARAGHHWHNAVLQLTAHWVARGWSNAEIIAQAEGLTLPGYTHDQTRSELREMIDGARRKWSRPNTDVDFDPVTGEIIEAPVAPGAAAVPLTPAGLPVTPFVATPAGPIDPRALPRREWVLGERLIRRFVTATVAAPGVGKSTLTMQEMVAIATADQRLTGDAIRISGPTWIYNGEDPLDELQRRLAAITIHWLLDPDAVGTRVFLNSGRTRRLIVAQTMGDAVVATPDVEACIEQIKAHGIVAWTVDPFVRVHRVEENDNAQVDQVCDLFAQIADRTGCAINLVHHTRKQSQGMTGHGPGDLDMARGASALGGAARVASTLMTMSPRDAEDLGIEADERRWYVRLDDAKGSMSPPAERARWFKRISVDIPNGAGLGLSSDSVGVLEPWDPTPKAPISMARVLAVLRQIDQAWQSGDPYSAATNSPRYVVEMMVADHDWARVDARNIVKDWLRNTVLVSAEHSRKKKGLKVGMWPGSETSS